jgi:hypothetical protein
MPRAQSSPRSGADVRNLEIARRLLDGESTGYTTEKRYIRSDGEVVWAILSVSLIQDRAGVPLYFVSQAMDITERKLAEGTLRDRDAIMRAVRRCAEALPPDERAFFAAGSIRTLVLVPVRPSPWLPATRRRSTFCSPTS